jgi:hypothetical protein
MRSGPLSDVRLVSFVQSHFVPVAVNQLKLRERKDAEGDLFRSIRQQDNTYQGIWFVTPDGKVLEQAQSRYTEPYLTAAQSALETWQTLNRAASKPLPSRATDSFDGLPAVAEGNLRLSVFVRRLNSPEDGLPAYDHVDLTADEWRSFIPAQATAGARGEVAQTALRKMALTFWPDALSDPIRPKEIKAVEMTATLDKLSEDEWHVRLTGKVSIEGNSIWGSRPRRTYYATLRGVARYRPSERTLTALRIVADGSWHVEESFGKISAPGRLGVVIEWQSTQVNLPC